MLTTYDLLPDGQKWFLAFDPNGSNKPLKQVSGFGRKEYDEAVARLTARNVDVWTARAGFAADAETRSFKNVAGVKCYSIDIDIEPSGMKGSVPCHATQEAALQSLLRLRKDGVIPRVSALVSSGYGLHVWWKLDEAVTPAVWLAGANNLKKRIAAADPMLAVDTTRWVDASGLLRPWPSTNFKHGASRPVEALVLSEDVEHPVTAFAAAVAVAEVVTQAPGIRVRTGVAPEPKGKRKSRGDEPPPRTLLPLAEIERTCAVLRHYKDNLIPTASEPEWRTALSVVCSSVEWETAVHDYSRGHPDYDAQATDDKAAKIIAANTPPSCAVIRRNLVGDSENTSKCAGCPFAGQPSHPKTNFIGACRERRKLGGSAAATPARPPAQVPPPAPLGASLDPITTAADLELRLGDVSLPPYIGDGSGDSPFYVARVREDDRDAAVYGPQRKPELPSVRMFRPAWWVDRHCGEHSLVAWIKDGETRTGLIKRSALGGMQSLLTALGGLGIAAQADRSPDVAHAINAYAELLQNSAPTLPSYNRCGITEDDADFVVGGVAVAKNGEVRRAVPEGPHAVTAFKRIGAAGSLTAGHALLGAVGRVGSTQAKFAVVASLGSALLGLSTMTGAMVNLYGPRSTGKSVMQTVAASFWGAPSAYMQHGEDTPKSNASYAGALGSLPLIIDEITLMKDEDMAEFTYMIAMGRPKHANNSDGTPRNVPRGWRLTAFTSANRPVRDVVSSSTEHTDVDAAKQARILEMYCASAVLPGKETAMATMMALAHKNYGLVGINWARHIIANAPRLRARLDTICVALRKRSPICDRYIGATIGSYLLACEDLRDLGLWPCSAAEDEAVVRAVIAENEKDVVTTTNGKFATLTETVRRALMPSTLIFQQKEGGAWVCLNPAENMLSVKARIEISTDGTVRTIAVRSEVARIIRDCVQPQRDKMARSAAMTSRQVEHYIALLPRAGLAFDTLQERVRLGAGASVKFAVGAPSVCITWTDTAAFVPAALPGRPKIATVDGEIVVA
jgi:hypothetical protein